MEESIVKVSTRSENSYDRSYSIVTKKGWRKTKSVIMILRDLECGVFDYDFL